MPFKSKQQAKKCYALKQKGQAGNWDCSEWAEKTNFRSIPQSKEAFSMTASSHLARIKQAASMAVLQPAFQKLADDHFGGDINDAIEFCQYNNTHPVALLKMAGPMVKRPPMVPGYTSRPEAVPQVLPADDKYIGRRPMVPGEGSLSAGHVQREVHPAPPGNYSAPKPMVPAKISKGPMSLLKLLSKNKLLAGGAAGALGLAGLGLGGRAMRGSPEAGGGMPADVAPGAGGLGGGAGPKGGGGGAGGGMSPTMQALLGLGLVGGGAYGASRVLGGKKKKQASDNFANRVLTRVITKKASAVLRAESVRRVNTYLDKLASAVSFPEQAQIRLIQGNLAAGNSLAHAIKRACPNLPAESRGVLAAELVKKAAASVR